MEQRIKHGMFGWTDEDDFFQTSNLTAGAG
jgi:hypothetical protein